MKIILTTANSRQSVVIEGSSTELQPIVQSLLQVAKSPSDIQKDDILPVLTPVAAKKIPANILSSNDSFDTDLAKQFVNSIFVYKPTTTTLHGRGRYIADMLASGKSFTRFYLVNRSKATPQCLRNVVNKMRKAGAVFHIDQEEETIRLVSVPNKKYAKAHRSNKGKQNRKPKSSNNIAIAALSGRRHK